MGFVPVRRGRARPVEERPAELLYTKKCLVHGQIVDVQVWGPDPSGRAEYKKGEDIVEADRAAQVDAKKNYHPRTELAYMHLTSGAAASVSERQHSGEAYASRNKRRGRGRQEGEG